MMSPEELERQHPTAFDLPIMKSWERAEPAQYSEEMSKVNITLMLEMYRSMD
jgi:hypothetical protein